MDSKELRIGNYVLSPEGNTCEVYKIEDDKYYPTVSVKWVYSDEFKDEMYSTEHIIPIPLTPEILNNIEGWDAGMLGISDRKNWDALFLCLENDCVLSLNYSMDTGCDAISHERELGVPYIRYVHQLQNLFFALTNKELPLTL